MKRTSLLLSAALLGTALLWPSNWLHGAEPSPGRQVEQVLETEGGDEVPYLLYLPEGYEEREGDWPLMLFLHGRGESYGPLALVQKWGPPRLVARGESLPYILVSPQCPGEGRWSDETRQAGLLGLLEHIRANYRVDGKRLYLTGLSMGGYGSWTLAAAHPEMFAAVAPICGGGDPADGPRLKEVPLWVFHGTEDKAVPLSRSAEMVEAIRKAGGTQVRFTILEHIGHNSWSAAYATPELYQWFDRHSLD